LVVSQALRGETVKSSSPQKAQKAQTGLLIEPFVLSVA
jgi:hypothetical protein